ncbi:MAG TPA: M1 family metallopeptidase, partial [Ignavibacteriaceae bacterium]|nr:M1 family metallopeptidase [Ignavibacteriaceae bacterium]
MNRISLLFGLFLATSQVLSQPSEYFIPLNIQKGYSNNTRSFNGMPGKNYWQNKCNYEIKVTFDPSSAKLKGEENIFYYNNSPDTLRELVFHIFPDLYKKGNKHDFDINPSDQMEGLTLTEFLIDGKKVNLNKNKNLSFGHTSFILYLNKPVLPGSKINLDISWNYVVNKTSNIRTGGVDSSTYFIAYFFPRLAVYDDINGWNYFDYTGDAEFYNDFGDFKLEITVTENFIVWATGLLQNPDEVFSEEILNRYNKSLTSNEIIHILDPVNYLNKKTFQANSFNTWKVNSENVTDVAFALSDHYLWDAVSLVVDSSSGRRMIINTAYNKSSQDFYEVAGINRLIINYMSNNLPGIPFPFPAMTIFNGLDYMEYPMMVNDTTLNLESAYELTTHETYHSYFPFYMGINESNYAWMDEGITSFMTYLLMRDLYPGNEINQPFGDEYKDLIGNFGDEPIFVNSNKIKRPNYDFIYYDKALSFFLVLRNYLSDNNFKTALKEFIRRWNGKHPTPYDLFFTFENVTRKYLYWLIEPWFFE